MAYVFDVFTVPGGVFVPDGAALVEIGAAAVVRYVRDGLLVAWIVSFAFLFGFCAYHAFSGLSYRTFSEQLGYFLDPEGLFVYRLWWVAAISAIIIPISSDDCFTDYVYMHNQL